MTIQFFSHWNGLDGIQTLATVEEARLVGLGVARYYTKDMDGGPSDPLAAISEAVGDMKGLVISTSAPSDADGSPVGTIYFQIPA